MTYVILALFAFLLGVAFERWLMAEPDVYDRTTNPADLGYDGVDDFEVFPAPFSKEEVEEKYEDEINKVGGTK